MLLLIAVALAIFVLPSPWGIVLVVVAGIIDIAESGLLVWWSQRRKASVGAQALVGKVGVTIGQLWPTGQINVYWEIWKARC